MVARSGMERSGHVGVVLAAGGSVRLGRPKQLLARAGEPLLRHVVRAVAHTGPEALYVVLGGHRARIAPVLHDLPCQIVDNPAWSTGLASSLQILASVLPGTAGSILLTGCDQPALHSRHLRALLAGAAAMPSGCAATRYAGVRGIPAVVPARWWTDVRHLQGEQGFGPRLRTLSDQACFTVSAPALALDLDTEADVRVAIARRWLDPEAALVAD